MKNLKITLDDVRAELERRKYNKLQTFFPDTGKFSRDKYPKHLDIMAAGADWRERCFMAANRCLTPWTFLANNQPILLGACSESFYVQAWDGETLNNAQAQQSHLKGIEKAFRVVLDNGQFFDCTREHRVLTDEGWLSFGQLMSLSNGLSLKHKPEDYQANCVADGYLCGQQPQYLKDIVSALSPSLADVPAPCLVWNVDEAERILQCSQASQEHDQFSSKDDLCRLLGLFYQFSAPACDKSYLSLSCNILNLSKFLRESCPNQLDGIPPEYLELASQSPSYFLFSDTLELEDYCTIFPSRHPSLVGGGQIVSVAPLGLQPIIDWHVPFYNNYLLSGVIHHNCGKSETGAFETACHLTGIYPSWWVGRRFHKAVSVIAAGETGKLVRDSMQFKLMGSISDIGTGFIPKDSITEKKPKSGIPDAFDMVYIKHKSGGTSVLQFQSYDQGREAFQATERDFIWFDEEPPQDVYSEALIRTMTTKGCVLTTFTPLKGVSETVLSLQDKAEKGAAYVVIATWDDAPHLDEQTKQEMLAALPPHQRDARSKGVPALGSGAVYQVVEADILCDPFPIPAHFKQLYGMDVGWNNTAAAWGAYDPDNDIIYMTSDYKKGQSEPAVHASAIKGRGDWIPGAIDPASRGRAQHDGEQLINLYRAQGLKLQLADNAVEAGVFNVYERLSTGRLKIFRTCVDTLVEYRLYRRDEKGKIVKQNDHIMDALRYMVMSIIHGGIVKIIKKTVTAPVRRSGWMG